MAADVGVAGGDVRVWERPAQPTRLIGSTKQAEREMTSFFGGGRVKRAAPRSQRLEVAGTGGEGVHAYGGVA